jgi:adenine deaminase
VTAFWDGKGRRELVGVATGRAKADKIITDAQIVNVATREVYPGEIAIKGDRIAAIGDVGYTAGPETERISAGGRHVVPGLIDGHLHCYHSYLGVAEFTEGMLSHGVTATADGFYGQAIVGGRRAVEFFKDAFDQMPLRVIFLVPMVGYIQNRDLGLTPTPGIDVQDLHDMLSWPDCAGLEEPPPTPVLQQQDELLRLFEETLAQRKVITGHAAGVTERVLQAYIAMGTYTDHEMVNAEESLARARLGMKLLAREGSGAPDVREVIRPFSEGGIDRRSFGFCTDLLSPEMLLGEGGIDHAVRVAISRGIPPVEAIQMATLNVAETFFVQHDIGILAPGRYADMLFLDDLSSFEIGDVLVGGEFYVREGRFVGEMPAVRYSEDLLGSVKLEKPVEESDLALDVGDASSCHVRVIGVTGGSLETEIREATIEVRDGVPQPDVENDVLPIAMIDRHGKGTGIGLGFVQGFQFERGALASSVNAVCENIVVVGASYSDMAVAVQHLADVDGGVVMVVDGEVVASVELPILGLMSREPLHIVSAKFDRLFEAIRDAGCTLRNPLSQLEFSCACGEIPAIKISDEGLILVREAEVVDAVLELAHA